MADGFYNIAGPGLAFGTQHSRTFTNATQCLTQIASTTDKGHREKVLVHMEALVGGSQHLRFVDTVNSNGLQDLSFYEMADAALRHHRNGDRFFNPNDKFGITHP